MLVVMFFVMMKILEFSSGLILDTEQLKTGRRKKRIKKNAKGLGVGRGMTTVDELSVSPASDCNSNNVDVSYTSTTSDAEFIQDNCDYQWFVDYGYREVHHPSVLSSCYDEMARDLDSQLAQVDMEDYTAQDILSTLPAMCCTELQSERQGEMFASVSGSLMNKFEFDSSISPHTSSQDESSMSLCQSEPLFSPVKEGPLLPTNYSVDSLDCEEQDLMVTCQANKHNYTIAFHGSTVMGDTSEYTDTGESMCSNEGVKKSSKMAASDAPTTTWSKLRKVPTRQRHRSKTVSLPDLAPKLSTSLALGGCVKLFDIQNSSSVTSESFSGSGENRSSFTTQKQGNFSLLRLFIAQRNNAENTNDNSKRGKTVRNTNELNSLTDAAWMVDDHHLSACYEDSLVRGNSATEQEPESSSVERLSSKSISICSCSMSASSNKFNVNNNNSFEHETQKHNVRVGTQTSGSDISDLTSSSEQTNNTRVPASLTGRCPVHCIDRSMQTSLRPIMEKNKEQEASEDEKKPVYVLYPNYTLPDLGFLRHNCLDLDKVLLAPLKFTGPNTPQTPPVSHLPYRTVTRQDIDMLKQKGLSHVLDWSSLTPLLPSEYWSILAELPQVKQHSTTRFENTRPHFCITPTQNKETISFPDGRTNVNTSGCSTGTAPSSGYRGSSTLLTESGEKPNPLYVYNYSSEEKTKSKNKQADNQENKRFSMFEFAEGGGSDDTTDAARKRKSLPNHAGVNKEALEKEVWEDWWHDTKQRPNSPPFTHALRLDQLIELSGSDQWQPQDIQTLRDQVSKFLSEAGRKCVSFADKGDQQLTPPNSPTCQKTYQCKHPGLSALHMFPDDSRRSRVEVTDKKSLVDGVAAAVDKILSYKEDNVSQVVLDTLCPSLYALLSDELKHQLETPFGPIGNSVWQVVEASAQQGLMTKALNDLVMKLNSEDVLSEGLIKFNAFVFGLLNVRGVDAWVSYVRTRESVLTKHYTEEGLLLAASRGHAKSRVLTDQLIKSLKPLAQCDFGLDLLYETRQLHQSLLQLTRLPLSPNQNIEMNTDSLLLRKIVQSIRNGLGNLSSNEESQILEGKCRPRSCVDAVGGSDLASTVRKRWSGVQVGSRLANAFDRLQSDEEYSDSLDVGIRTSSGDEVEKEKVDTANDKDGEKGGKFRSLQRKWELLSGKGNKSPDLSPVKSSSSSAAARSRIPRLVTSPVRPQSSRLPTPIQSKIPTPNSTQRPRFETGKGPKVPRPSRADIPQEKVVTSRPSSLPYRPPGGARVERRAASSSTARKSTNASNNRHVVTLTHRLPSDSGHLAFNEGERLRLVLEVDDTWLLCCRGDQKGLVPRSAVI